MALQDIYKKASLVMKPAAMKEGKLYSQQPHSGDGDFTFSRANGVQTRINKHGLIEVVADNTPRLSYELDDNGNVSECPTLLLEPSRTNLLERSEEFDNSYWTKSRSSITANQTTSPYGTNTADKLIDSTDNNTHLAFRSLTVSTSDAYTFSCFLKKGSLDKAFLAFDSTASQSVVFDLTNGSVESEGTGVTSSSIIEYPNEWYKCSFTHTPTSTTRLYRIGTYNGNISYAGTGTDFVYLFGAQVEVGSYPTSYIPTSGIAETRAQDDFENSFTGLTGTAATIFLDFETKGLDGNFRRLFAVHDSVTSDGIYLGIYSTNTIAFFGIDGGAGLPDVKDTVSFNERNKLVLSFDGIGNYKYSLNGSLQTGTYIGTSRQYDEIGRGNVIGGASNNIKINQISVFDEALSDSELTELTS
jgi:hypothetical protein